MFKVKQGLGVGLVIGVCAAAGLISPTLASAQEPCEVTLRCGTTVVLPIGKPVTVGPGTGQTVDPVANVGKTVRAAAVPEKVELAVDTIDRREEAAGYPTTTVTDRIPVEEGDMTVRVGRSGYVVVSDEGDVAAYTASGGSVVTPVGTSTLADLARLGAPVDAQTAMVSFTAADLLYASQRGFFDLLFDPYIRNCTIGLGKLALSNLGVFTKISKAGGVVKVAKKIGKAKGTRARARVLGELFGEVTGLDEAVRACSG